jgi:hypothetical protein
MRLEAALLLLCLETFAKYKNLIGFNFVPNLAIPRSVVMQ